MKKYILPDSFPRSFKNNEERFKTLQKIEQIVQNNAKTAQEKFALRHTIIRANPDVFKALYMEYTLPEERKKELDKIVDESVKSIALNKEMKEKILNFNSLEFADKKSLLENLAVYMMRDSGVNPFFNGVPHVELHIEETDRAWSGYATNITKYDFTSSAIYINKKDIDKANNIHDLLNTFFHEALHTTQSDSPDNFLGLSSLYYIHPDIIIPEWNRRDQYITYQKQPKEAEAWYLGTQIEKHFIQRLKEQDLTPHFTHLGHILTGHPIKPENISFKRNRGGIEIILDGPTDPDITPEFLRKNELPLKIETDPNTKKSHVYISVSTQNNVNQYVICLIDDLKIDYRTTNSKRKHFQKTILEKFATPKGIKPIEQTKNALVFEGNHPEIIHTLNMLRSNVYVRYDKKTNQTRIDLPLQFQSYNQKDITSYFHAATRLKDMPIQTAPQTQKQSITR